MLPHGQFVGKNLVPGCWAARAYEDAFRGLLKCRNMFQAQLGYPIGWELNPVVWFDWRDPTNGAGGYCSFCASAGLLRHNSKPKPAYRAFRHFTRGG